MLTQASTADSNEALLKILTSKAPTSIESQTQELSLASSVIHPVAYISGRFSQSQCRWPAITKECYSVFMSITKCSFYLQNANLLVCTDDKPLLKIFTGHTGSDKCNIWGLEAASIPRRVKVQHIKGIANFLANSVLRLKAVGLFHDIDSNDNQQEFSTPFEPLLPVLPVMHMPLEVNEVFTALDIERLMQTYDTLHESPTEQNNDDVKLPLENALPTDILQLEQNLMSPPD